MSVDLRKDMHIIPIGDGMHIIYAPLHGASFMVSDKAASLCRSYINGVTLSKTEENYKLLQNLEELENRSVEEPQNKHINTTSSLVVILSQMCNLACSYCFAQDSRSKDVLSKDKLKVAIDYILAQNSKNKRFSFIGGGEPTVTWELLTWAITYIRSKDTIDRTSYIGITTNGTLFNQERIDFIHSNKVNLNLSFEVLPDIQNSQRCFPNPDKKSFDTVNELIHQLDSSNISYSFRSTITKLNVAKMTDMVEFVKSNYPNVKYLHLEPVTSIDNDKVFYDNFINYFMEALKLGKHYKIKVYCSVSRSLNNAKRRFCLGEFCLTPTGEFVACHRISSKEDTSFDLFSFARIEGNQVVINQYKQDIIEDFYNDKKTACNTCFVKWHCAGSCAMERKIYSSDMQEQKCYFFKTLTTKLLVEKLRGDNNNCP